MRILNTGGRQSARRSLSRPVMRLAARLVPPCPRWGFCREETNHFLETCKEMFPENDLPAYSPFFLCAFRTGMRLGELLGLRLGDIDWHGRFIEVKRAYKRGYMVPTKTGKARRVDISDHLAETLNHLYKWRIEEAMKA